MRVVILTQYHISFFNEVSNVVINQLFDQWYGYRIKRVLPDLAKIRIIQYTLAEVAFKLWTNTINTALNKNFVWRIDRPAFCLVFPNDLFDAFDELISSSEHLKTSVQTDIIKIDKELNLIDSDFVSQLKPVSNDYQHCPAMLRTKLIEPFTNLYFEKEMQSRQLVLTYGKSAFEMPGYKSIIERLKHGYSYHMLLSLLDEFSDFLDKVATVSLFIDESIDAGIIVPIIAEEYSDQYGKFFFRAFRHGEDVPFGELEEKLCSILLRSYEKEGGARILSKTRIEKMLVLFVKIGLKQGIFRTKPHGSSYYKVNVDAYLHGNITTAENKKSKRSQHFLTHKTEATWLTDVLHEKGIIHREKNGLSIKDPINISIDKSTVGMVSAIGQTFAMLYKNKEQKQLPYITDKDLICFSTCLYPQDVLNALASELSIFDNRWNASLHVIKEIAQKFPHDLQSFIRKSDMFTSLNSGQFKFLSFSNKYAQHRVQEISELLNSSKTLSIFGTQWDQFWPDNIGWDEHSIDISLLNLIISEALIIFRFLLNLYVLFYQVSIDTKEKEKWVKKSKIIKEHLSNKIFSHHVTAISKDIEYANSIIGDKQRVTAYSTDEVLTTINKVNRITIFIPSILADVELILDKHGQPCKIERFVHSIHIVKTSKMEKIRCTFEACVAEAGIDMLAFQIAESSEDFSAPGLWFFLKKGKPREILQVILKSIKLLGDATLSIDCFQVFYNLSESIRLKMSSTCNTRKHFGRFLEYSSVFCNLEKKNNHLSWICENTSNNRSEISKFIDNDDHISLADKFQVEIVTSMSSNSNVYELQLLSNIDKYRKAYKKMKKCSIFVSYSDDSPEHVRKVTLIVERLINENFDVLYYRYEPLGTDLVAYMRKITEADITLIIGSSGYINKSKKETSAGVSFEDRLIATIYMSDYRNRIIPISFEKIKDTVPAPFNEQKGMEMSGPTSEELDQLVCGLIHRLQKIHQK